MGCNCGFGGSPSGGGGGGGNLSGDLTAGQMPVASGAHALEDSIVAADADRATVEGTVRINSVGNNPGELFQANGGTEGGFKWEFNFARGTIAAPTAVDANDFLGGLSWFGWNAAAYAPAASLRASVGDSGVTGGGEVPAVVLLSITDNAGGAYTAWRALPSKDLEVPRLYVSGRTRQGIATLASVANVVAIQSDLSNWFELQLTENTTLGNPSLSETGRYFQIRIRQGAAAYTVAYDTKYRFGASGAPTLSTDPDATDYIAFQYNEIDDTWDYVGGSVGFAAP